MNAPAPLDRLPVSVITGFLGSGKTTLLNALLARPELANTAVIVNEFGEIGLDHLLMERLDETTVLLNSGCLCCTVRGDLVTGLRDLLIRRARGAVPAFERVAIETTGLADPAPILHTLMTDALIAAKFRLDGVITTVDAVNGAAQLDAHLESVKQAAVADRLVLTKTDLANPTATDDLRTRLARLNPGAPILDAAGGDLDPEALFHAGLYDPRRKTLDVRRWLKAEAYAHPHTHGDHDPNRHDARIRAFCLTLEAPVDWMAFVSWVEMLIEMRGDHLLRIKGLIHVAGEPTPVAIHGVQHVFHPPATLPAWPDDDRRSRLVFITRDLGRQVIADSLEAFLEHDPIKRNRLIGESSSTNKNPEHDPIKRNRLIGESSSTNKNSEHDPIKRNRLVGESSSTNKNSERDPVR